MVEYFSIENPNGSIEENVPHYTVDEAASETGFHHQTVRNRIYNNTITSTTFKRKHYISQKEMDKLRAESPKSRHRVGKVGVVPLQNQNLTDLL